MFLSLSHTHKPGPVSLGANKFIFDCPAPDASRIPQSDLMEVTVILLTCSYRESEFIRIGYYVNNDYPAAQTALQSERQQWLDECNRIRAAQQDWLNAQAEAKQQAAAAAAAATANGTAPTDNIAAPAVAPVNTSGDMEMCNSNEATPAAAVASNAAATAASAAATASTSSAAASVAAPSFTLPQQPHVRIEALQREILADKPRVTRFQIDWNSEEMRQLQARQRAMQQQQQASSSASTAAPPNATDASSGEFEMSSADRLAAEQSARQTEVAMAVRRTNSGHIVQAAHESALDSKEDDNQDDDDDDGMEQDAMDEEQDSDESDSSELAEVYELVDADDAATHDSKENRAPMQQQQQQSQQQNVNGLSLAKPNAAAQSFQQQQTVNTSGSMMD